MSAKIENIKPLKLCLICMRGLLYIVAIWQENQLRALC